MKTFNLKGQTIVDMSGVNLYFENVDMLIEFFAICRFKYKSEIFIIDKQILADEFFNMGSGYCVALRAKCHDYNAKLVIVGDYYIPSQDEEFSNFKYSCNNGKHLFLVSSKEEGISLLKGVM